MSPDKDGKMANCHEFPPYRKRPMALEGCSPGKSRHMNADTRSIAPLRRVSVGETSEATGCPP